MARHGSLRVEDYECPESPTGGNHVLTNELTQDGEWLDTSCQHCGWAWRDLDQLVRHLSGFYAKKRTAS